MARRTLVMMLFVVALAAVARGDLVFDKVSKKSAKPAREGGGSRWGVIRSCRKFPKSSNASLRPIAVGVEFEEEKKTLFFCLQVKRTIDVSTHLVKISSVATVRNEGDSLAQSVTFSTDPLLLKHLASVTASVKAGKKVSFQFSFDHIPL